MTKVLDIEGKIRERARRENKKNLSAIHVMLLHEFINYIGWDHHQDLTKRLTQLITDIEFKSNPHFEQKAIDDFLAKFDSMKEQLETLQAEVESRSCES